ncbi:MAG: hypothetical protein EOO27_43420 [Comamonadaceae bacterium]|nr:MAG: hypothetical protein EOO27_43420 [Comamonadaceae bacterium]
MADHKEIDKERSNSEEKNGMTWTARINLLCNVIRTALALTTFALWQVPEVLELLRNLLS